MSRGARGAAALLAAVLLAGCGATAPVASPDVVVAAPLPAGAAEATSAPAPPAAQSCDTASLAPGPRPREVAPGSATAAIVQRGRLVVGVDQNTYLFGFRNPFTGRLEGFDIDIAREVARDLLGDPDRITFRVLTSAQRIPALQAGDVDLVVRTMTVTCDRLQQVGFSSVYYQAAQRILARTDAGITGAATLGGKRVCATTGSTSVSTLLALDPAPTVVSVADWTDCLVLVQQGQADAVSTDDSILAGLKTQDPYLDVVGEPLSPEPYGIGVRKESTDLQRYVNGVLDRIRADGTWAAIYGRWLSGLGPTPAPPAAQYRP
ncbi:glutamate ABC transporter substrate-binding protein [Rhodococcus aerolatus]